MLKLKFEIKFVILLALLNITIDSFSQKSINSINVNEKELKQILQFDKWLDTNNEIRNGINLSNNKLLTLNDATEVQPKSTFNISKISDDKSFILYRSKWKFNNDINNYIEISISFFDNTLDAKNYLFDHYIFDTPLPYKIKTNLKDTPTIVGNVSFLNGHLFIRDNIVVSTVSEGVPNVKIEDVVKEIDEIILSQNIIKIYEKFTPRIYTDSNNVEKIIAPD